MIKTEKQMYSMGEVERLLGIERHTLLRIMKRGEIDYYIVGRQYRFKNKVKKIKEGIMDFKEQFKNVDIVDFTKRLRHIDVVELAERMGFEQDKYDKKAYRRGNLKVSIDEKTGRFNSFIDPTVKGIGSIDFVMKTENKKFAEAIEFLSNEYSIIQPNKPLSFQQKKRKTGTGTGKAGAPKTAKKSK